MTNQEIISTGQTIKNETRIGGNTAERVGGVIEGIGENLTELAGQLYETGEEEVSLNTESGKYIADSGNLAGGGSATDFAVKYVSCSQGDKFVLTYPNNGPSNGAARCYAVYSVIDINSASSSNVLAKGYTTKNVVANEEIEIEVTNSNAKLLCVTQFVSGNVSLIPTLKKVTELNKFDKLTEEIEDANSRIDSTNEQVEAVESKIVVTQEELFVIDNKQSSLSYQSAYKANDYFVILPYMGKDITFDGTINVELGASFVIRAKNKVTGNDVTFLEVTNATETSYSFSRLRTDLEFINFRILFYSTSQSGNFSLELHRTDDSINDKIKNVAANVVAETERAKSAEITLETSLNALRNIERGETLISVDLSIKDDKYIADSGNLPNSSDYKVHYAPCEQGDRFVLHYEQDGPSASAAKMYAIYSADNIDAVGSGNLLVKGENIKYVVANQNYEIEITSENANLICFQQFTAGTKNLIPKVEKVEVNSIDIKEAVNAALEELAGVEKELKDESLRKVSFDQDAFIDGAYITSDGNLGSSDTYGCYKIPCSKGDKFSLFVFKSLGSTITRSYAIYSNDSVFNSGTLIEVGKVSAIGRENIEITSDSAKMLVIGWRTVADVNLFKIEDVSAIASLKEDVHNIRWDAEKVHFDIGHELKTTNIREVFDLSENNVRSDYYGLSGLNSIMFQIQDKMDELVSANPNYITKSDAADYVGLTYPSYANGIETEGTYLVTPRYRTYMYKMSYVNAGVNGKCNRPTSILITGGVHGNEESGSLNLYTIMKELCNDYLTDINIFKARGAFDLYIVPCVNGYCSIHRNRVNANGVNINRNFPIAEWAEQGDSDPTSQNYRGPSAGSEFETQLIMGLINTIKPDMYIDAHNYSTSDTLQFYAEIPGYNYVRAAYDCLADVSFTLKKSFPQWFGENYAMLKGDATTISAGHAPADDDNDSGAKAPTWVFRHSDVKFAATLEISGGINYNHGVLDGHDPRIEEVYQIGEYTMMNFLMRYGEMISNKIISPRYWEAG